MPPTEGGAGGPLAGTPGQGAGVSTKTGAGTSATSLGGEYSPLPPTPPPTGHGVQASEAGGGRMGVLPGTDPEPEGVYKVPLLLVCKPLGSVWLQEAKAWCPVGGTEGHMGPGHTFGGVLNSHVQVEGLAGAFPLRGKCVVNRQHLEEAVVCVQELPPGPTPGRTQQSWITPALEHEVLPELGENPCVLAACSRLGIASSSCPGPPPSPARSPQPLCTHRHRANAHPIGADFQGVLGQELQGRGW